MSHAMRPAALLGGWQNGTGPEHHAHVRTVPAGAPEPDVAGAPLFTSGAVPEGLARRVGAVLKRVADAKGTGGYFNTEAMTGAEGASVLTERGARKLTFSSYNYLGLMGDARIGDAAADAVRRLGTGTHGSRLLGGTTDLHGSLERAVASFLGRDDAIVFSSGFMANQATLCALVGDGDWVFQDRANHASLIDGCAASGARSRRYRHNDAGHLEHLLAAAPRDAVKLVVTDAIFSMDGDILDLPGIVAACRRHGALLMVDEAHSFGVLGADGRGIEDHYGMPGCIDVLMGTLSKAVPASGGFVAGTHGFVEYLRFAARGYVYSGATPPPMAGAALKAIEIIAREGDGLRARLNRNAESLRTRLLSAGFSIGPCRTAIVPVLLSDDAAALAITRFCQRHRLFVLPVLPPAVPPGTARLRLTVTAAHAGDEIERAVDLVAAARRHL